MRHNHMPLLRERQREWVSPPDCTLLDSSSKQDALTLTKEPRHHILLVDDDTAVRRCVRLFLEFQGYACTEATNGIQALEELGKHNFSLIITDNQMPRLDGISFLETYHSQQPHHRIPAIIVTGHLNSALQSRADKIGITTIFQKPCGFEDLSDAIGKLM